QPCLFGHCCSGSCVNTYTSSTHCGSCGNTCQPNAICFSGECVTTSFADAAPGFEPYPILLLIFAVAASFFTAYKLSMTRIM
ncbi:MAG: hypothetical protein DRO99_04980, partial [Candidatus Aenigmatarchaeota archaeon]